MSGRTWLVAFPATAVLAVVLSCRPVEGPTGVRLSLSLAPELTNAKPDHLTVRIAGSAVQYLCYLPGSDTPIERGAPTAAGGDPCLDVDVLGAGDPNPWPDTVAHPIILNVLTDAAGSVDVVVDARRGGSITLGSIEKTLPTAVPLPVEALLVPIATPPPDLESILATKPTAVFIATPACRVGDQTSCIAATATADPTQRQDRYAWTRAIDCACPGLCVENTADKGVCPGNTAPSTVWRYYPVTIAQDGCRSLFAQVRMARCLDPAIDGEIAAQSSGDLSHCKLTAACTIPKGTAIVVTSNGHDRTVDLTCVSPRTYPVSLQLPTVAPLDALSLVQPALGPTDCLPVAACATHSDGPAQPPPLLVLSHATTEVVFEVAYQKGVAPAAADDAAAGGTTNDPWRIAEANLARILPQKRVTLPHALSEMTALDGADRSAYTREDILAIASAQRRVQSSGARAAYFVVWVDSLYAHDGSEDPGVLGAYFDGTGVVAIFMPALQEATRAEEPAVVRFVEQSTLVHELGHALGLVDDGVSPTSEHKDPSHGAHCTNPACVMFWENEGKQAAVAFARKYVRSSDAILFADDCLRDIDAAAAH